MSLKNFLLDCLFPKKCYGCGQNGTWLCRKCFDCLETYQGQLPRSLENPTDLIIAGEYRDNLLNTLITAFKFGFNQELALPLAVFLIKTIDKKILLEKLTEKMSEKTETSPNKIIIVPLPLYKTRLKWRGFNQSELLAREISRYYNWPVNLDLVKIKKTLVQSELDETARLTNQSGAFKWIGSDLKGQTILLIDDIITSGATMNEAEKILLAVGAKRIIKAAVAKG